MLPCRSALLLALFALPLACGDDGGSDGGDSGANATTVGAADTNATPADGSDGAVSTDDGTAMSTGAGDTSADDTTGAAETGEATTTGATEPPPPTDSAALIEWLEAGSYLRWSAESAVHESDGPHFGAVRTYMNDSLVLSMEANNDVHPMGASVVKELYGGGAGVLGWSVLVKVQDAPGGDSWYFLEYYEGTTYGDGVGDGSCTGCHGSDSRDFIKSPFPLQ